MLGVAGMVVAGIMFAAGRVSRSTSINKAGEQLFEIVANVRGIYTSQRGIYHDNSPIGGCNPADLTAKLSCQGAFPSDMIGGVPGTPPANDWGAVVVEPMDKDLNTAAAAAPGETSFGVRYANLPVDVCIALASRISAPDQKMMLRAVLFGGPAGTAYTAAGTVWANGTSLPVNPTQAVTECQNAAAGGLVTLEWAFMLR